MNKKFKFNALLISLISSIMFTSCDSNEPAPSTEILITSDTTLSNSQTSIDNKDKIIINYIRSDNNYTNWNMWVWQDGKEGKDFSFTEINDNGAKLILDSKDFNGNLGFIIKKEDWSDKDTDDDRFFSINTEGDTEVFIVSEEKVFFYDQKDVENLSNPRVTSAILIDEKTLEVNSNSADIFSDDNLKSMVINQEDSNIEFISNKKITDTKYELTLSDTISYTSPKTLNIDGFDNVVVNLSQDLFKSPSFIEEMTYTGELGAIYSQNETVFKLWAPFASKVEVNTYSAGFGDNNTGSYEMKPIGNGVFEFTLDGDNNSVYYDYSVTNGNSTIKTHDPYAKASGVNSIRSMVIDLDKTNPKGWENDTHIHSKDEYVPQTDAIIYELHVRDLSMDNNSNIKNQGKFLAFTETDTKTDNGVSTGLSHIKELGVNYIHLLPVYDYISVDEMTNDTFNWGYDPVNYNVPEGSYSTDATDGAVRINEFKQMVQAIHNECIGVVMDVVYNHTAKSNDSHFNLIAPDYYYRYDNNGNFSNGSGCGNEIASDREMVKQYIIDSVTYWAEEYHIDGFRFDLMGVLDIDTMNEIRTELDKINPNILIYGEGWTGGNCALPESEQAKKSNTKFFDNRIACFSDDIRDALKGNVFNATDGGYVNTLGKSKAQVMFGITASTQDVKAINAWANEPTQVVTYVSAHDNYTLYDKLKISTSNATEEELIAMNNLASAITLTSQGMSFIHAGEEMLRTKPTSSGFDENSYKSSDEVNMLDWQRKEENLQVFEYYKGLIDLRKTHDEFRYSTAKEIEENLKFIETDDNTIVYTLEDKFIVIFNPYEEEKTIKLPQGEYKYYVNKTTAKAEAFGDTISNEIIVEAISATVLGLNY